MKIIQVNYHRNGSGGTGFHAVRFDEGRGKAKRRYVGVVFPERASVAVLDVDLLAGLVGVGADNRFGGGEFEHELRGAVLAYEKSRAGGDLEKEEVLDLTYGRHACLLYRESRGLILDVPEGACVLCRRIPCSTSP